MIASLLAVGLFFLPIQQVNASGSFRPSTSKGVAMDVGVYRIGKSLFYGRSAPSGSASVGGQVVTLRNLSGKLKAPVAKKAKLEQLAGKLSSEELAALIYYIEIRYKIKL